MDPLDSIDGLDALDGLGDDIADAITPAAKPELMRAPVPVWLAGFGICLAAAMGIALGLRVGRALGAATLSEPPTVKPILVERCHDCAERLAAADAAAAVPPVTAADVDAMLARQAEVERAAE